MSAADRVREARTDSPVITTRNKAAAGGGDVRKSAAANADLKHHAVIAGGSILDLKVIEIGKRDLGTANGHGE